MRAEVAWTDIRNRMLTREIDDETGESHGEAIMTELRTAIYYAHLGVEMMIDAHRLARWALHDITQELPRSSGAAMHARVVRDNGAARGGSMLTSISMM